MTPELLQRLDALEDRLTALDTVVVAFSGGADSAFLLAACVRALGPGRVVAATSTAASLASGEWEAAHRFAMGLGVEHVAVATDEMDRQGYRANGADRCYHCKASLGDELSAMAEQRGFRHVAVGTNADDLAEQHRPGLRASAERGIVTPLADAGLGKADVRAASRAWGLATWDKPQAACLASRIAYGVPVDPERLARVDRAETAARAELRDAGLTVRNLRVRDLGDDARIEVDAALVDRVGATRLLEVVVASGFRSAEVDPRGFRSGSLNDSLSPTDLRPGRMAASSWDLPLVD